MGVFYFIFCCDPESWKLRFLNIRLQNKHIVRIESKNRPIFPIFCLGSMELVHVSATYRRSPRSVPKYYYTSLNLSSSTYNSSISPTRAELWHIYFVQYNLLLFLFLFLWSMIIVWENKKYAVKSKFCLVTFLSQSVYFGEKVKKQEFAE